MFSIKYTCSALVAALLMLAGGTQARAQYDIPLTPFQGFGDMVQRNLDFEAEFYKWAWQGSMRVARETRGQKLPFDAMTLYRANNEANHAFDGYLQSLQQGGARQIDAVENWGNQGLRGYSPYVNEYGQGYMLPYGPGAYYMDQGGYIRPGNNWNYPNTNYYPR